MDLKVILGGLGACVGLISGCLATFPISAAIEWLIKRNDGNPESALGFAICAMILLPTAGAAIGVFLASLLVRGIDSQSRRANQAKGSLRGHVPPE